MAARKPGPEDVAESMHSAALQLLRRLREHDVEMGLGTARSSALSVLVFGGSKSMTALAEIEQVRAPTMTRLVDRLEAAGLVSRTRPPGDRRTVIVAATPAGRRVLEQGRALRIKALAADLDRVTGVELRTLDRAAKILLRIQADARPANARRSE
ncbi:MAG TPA: MarR family transcriptional regulator [Candidatus Thermoplasmatota archaeon]